MTETERIADQLRRAFEGEAWHGPSLMELLADVSAAEAAARPVQSAHSIWELVLHVSTWEREANKRVNGVFEPVSAEVDWPSAGDASAEHWAAALEGAKRVNRELLGTISHLGDARLDDKAAGQEYSIYFLLHGVVQHVLYHAGQIAVLKKELRNPRA